ncbi:MAG: hypothetical protein EOM67_04720 [Spirochaetia bacterium]|nr:hypothetical protein [Spirochaetia bacterium]
MKIAVNVSAILTIKGVNMQTPEVEMSVDLDKWEDVELNIDLMYKSLKKFCEEKYSENIFLGLNSYKIYSDKDILLESSWSKPFIVSKWRELCSME